MTSKPLPANTQKKGFFRDNRGIFMILTALSALPIAVMITGMIDTITMTRTKAQITGAINLGLLAAKSVVMGQSTDTSAIENIIRTNIPVNGNGQRSLVQSLDVQTAIANGNAQLGFKTVTVNVEATIKKNLTSTLMGILTGNRPGNGNASETITVSYQATANAKLLPVDLVFVVDSTRYTTGAGMSTGSPVMYFNEVFSKLSSQASQKLKILQDAGMNIRIAYIPYTTAVNVGSTLDSAYISGGQSPNGCLMESWTGGSITSVSQPFSPYQAYLEGNGAFWAFEIGSDPTKVVNLGGDWSGHNCSTTSLQAFTDIAISNQINFPYNLPTTVTSTQNGQVSITKDGWGVPLPHVGLLWAARLLYANNIWSLNSSRLPNSDTQTKRVVVLVSGAPTGYNIPIISTTNWDTGIPRTPDSDPTAYYKSITNLDAFGAYGYWRDPKQMMQEGSQSPFIWIANPTWNASVTAASGVMRSYFQSTCNQFIQLAQQDKNLSLYSIGFQTMMLPYPPFFVYMYTPTAAHYPIVQACNTDTDFGTNWSLITDTFQAPPGNYTDELETRVLKILDTLSSHVGVMITT